MARFLLGHRVREACGFINTSGPAVFLQHFQGQLATAHLLGFSLNGLQESWPDSASPMRWQYREIMDVDERAGCEGRETPETNCDSHRFFTLPGQKDQRGRMLP